MNEDMIPVFTAGTFDYSDWGLDKPVWFSVNDLKAVASTVYGVDVTKKHSDETIGFCENLIVNEGKLFVKKPENVDLKGNGLSPLFKADLIEHEEYYTPTNLVLEKLGLTDSPRTNILYNSIKKEDKKEIEKEDDNLAEPQENKDSEVLEKIVDENKTLRDVIGALKEKLKIANESVETKNDLESKIDELEKSSLDNEKIIEDLKKKAEKYDSIEKGKKEELISKIAGDDSEALERLQKLDLGVLEYFAENQTRNTTPRGTGADADDIDDGLTPPPKEDDILTDEVYNSYV